MEAHHFIAVVVDGRTHDVSFAVRENEVQVYTGSGTRSAPIRRFEPQELARIMAVALLQTRKD